MMPKAGGRWGLHNIELLYEDSDNVFSKEIGGDLATTLIPKIEKSRSLPVHSSRNPYELQFRIDHALSSE